jgi:hypothetical protein
MQSRIREILEKQIKMRGGLSKRFRAKKGAKCGGQKKNGSEWINYLKMVEKDYGIPYNEAMRDPGVRKAYYSEYKGSGKLVGGIKKRRAGYLVGGKKRVTKRRTGSKRRAGYLVGGKKRVTKRRTGSKSTDSTKTKLTKSDLYSMKKMKLLSMLGQKCTKKKIVDLLINQWNLK